MKREGKSVNISEITKKNLQRYPYLEKYLKMGVINYRGLAREISKYVNSDVQKTTNIQSITTAIRRYSFQFKESDSNQLFKILANSEINLKYDIGVVTLKFHPEIFRKFEELKDVIRSSEIFYIIQGTNTLTIVLEDKFVEQVQKIYTDGIIEVRRDLALIFVKSPINIVETPGVIAHLANILSLKTINIVEMMSSYTETCFIIHEPDALEGLEAFRSEIRRSRDAIKIPSS